MSKTDHNREGDPMADLKYNLDSSLPKRPPWLQAEEEVQILERVEDQLLDAFRAERGRKQMQEAPDLEGLPSWSDRLLAFLTSGWSLAGGATLAGAAIFMFLHTIGGPPGGSLQVNGVAQLSKTPAAATNHELQLQAAPDKEGLVAEGKRWDMQIGATTRLAVARRGKQRRTIKLQRGFVKVHVVPGQVKEFSVKAAGYQVLVKGTVFTVEREGRWLRVEVTRGKVALRSPKGSKELPITKGHGLRVDLQSGQIQSYALPAQLDATSAAQPRKRLQWMLTQNREHAFQYGLDLAASRRYSRKARIQQLRWLYRKFESRGQYGKVLALLNEWSRLAGPKDAEVETGFIYSSQACLRQPKVAHCGALLKALAKRSHTPPSFLPARKKVLQQARQRGLLK